jgi:toxin-antitoxin system PIN domain toxin
LIAVDTNILVYAHRKDSAWHDPAEACVRELAEGRAPWAIPWPGIHEFYAIVTHPKIYSPPSKPARAMDQIEAWLESPGITLLTEGESYWPALKALVVQAKTAGAQIHDARVAALCRIHGVRELWTADRDFSRFGELRTHNPLS